MLIIIINHVILNFSKSIIANTGSASALNILFIGIIVLLFVQLLLFLFKHFSGQDILDVSQYLGGKILKVITGFLFITYFIVFTSILLRSFSENLKIIYLDKLPIIVIVIFFIFAITFGNKLGFKVISKVSHANHQQVDSEIAVMEMGVNIENHAGKDVQVKLQTSVYLQGKDGRPVGEEVTQSMTKDIAIKKDSWSSARFQFKVDKPKLWDIDTPNCYVAVSRVFMDGKEMDSYETPFGIRTIEFTHDQGFMLNGQKVAIKGVCMHHDLGALGAAFNEVAAERQLRIMKEMGANAIRTSHNPPAPELVALCDRMGLMMQLELADTWQKGKRKNDYNLLFDDWSEADMRSLVRHYRNHPSVIMWSIGNEMPDQTTDQGVIIARSNT